MGVLFLSCDPALRFSVEREAVGTVLWRWVFVQRVEPSDTTASVLSRAAAICLVSRAVLPRAGLQIIGVLQAPPLVGGRAWKGKSQREEVHAGRCSC